MNTNAIDSFLRNAEKTLPTIITGGDLVRLGLFSSATLHRMHKDGIAPSHFKINKRRIAYLKEDVIAWIRATYNTKNSKQD